jgi:hypothetical protein
MCTEGVCCGAPPVSIDTIRLEHQSIADTTLVLCAYLTRGQKACLLCCDDHYTGWLQWPEALPLGFRVPSESVAVRDWRDQTTSSLNERAAA